MLMRLKQSWNCWRHPCSYRPISKLPSHCCSLLSSTRYCARPSDLMNDAHDYDSAVVKQGAKLAVSHT